MRIFLTGSRGFIGSHLLPALIAAGHTVHAAGRNELPSRGAYDCVIHLAATTTISKDFTPGIYENNIVYARNIILGNPETRILYASSTSAYELTNPYAYSKKYNEYLGTQHPRAFGLRFFNCYGAGNNKGIIRRALHCAQTGETLELSGAQLVRDFIYIEDVTRIILDVLHAPENFPGQFLDIGTGRGLRIKEAVEIVQQVTGRYIRVRRMPYADLSNEQSFSVANPGIPNCISLTQGLQKMLYIPDPKNLTNL